MVCLWFARRILSYLTLYFCPQAEEVRQEEPDESFKPLQFNGLEVNSRVKKLDVHMNKGKVIDYDLCVPAIPTYTK